MSPPARGRDSGSAAAELAIVMPAIMLVLSILLAAAALGLTQLRLSDAARAGAREAARGESEAGISAEARRLAGSDAAVDVVTTGGWATVTVRLEVPPSMRVLLRGPLEASASARSESTADRPIAGRLSADVRRAPGEETIGEVAGRTIGAAIGGAG